VPEQTFLQSFNRYLKQLSFSDAIDDYRAQKPNILVSQSIRSESPSRSGYAIQISNPDSEFNFCFNCVFYQTTMFIFIENGKDCQVPVINILSHKKLVKTEQQSQW